jgi:hypothetical protein
MKAFLFWALATTISAILVIGCQSSNTASESAGVTLHVLNPRGEITLPPVSPPSARLTDFAGKKIGLYWNGKPGGIHFWNGVERLLNEKLPEAKIIRYMGGFDLGDELAAKIAKETDAFLYGVGD